MAQLSVKQLTEALKIRQFIDDLDAKKDKLQTQLDAVLKGGAVKKRVGRSKKKLASVKKKGATKKKAAKKKMAKAAAKAKTGPRRGSHKELIHHILADAKSAMSLDQIFQAMKARGYTSKSKEPKKSLGVLLYTDEGIQRAGRGQFRLGRRAAPKAKKK